MVLLAKCDSFKDLLLQETHLDLDQETQILYAQMVWSHFSLKKWIRYVILSHDEGLTNVQGLCFRKNYITSFVDL